MARSSVSSRPAGWNQAQANRADWLWRIKKNLRLPCQKRLSDGSYLSQIFASERDRRRNTGGVVVRVVEYRLQGVLGAEPIYRLLTTLLDAEGAPAEELVVLYHERWEMETALDEFKTHLRGSRIALRSKTPDLVGRNSMGSCWRTSPSGACCLRRH